MYYVYKHQIEENELIFTHDTITDSAVTESAG
jgi:hypothetical protein